MRFVVLLLALPLAGCGAKPTPAATPAPVTTPTVVRTPAETVTVQVRDPELVAELSRTKVQLLERNARVADLERKLAESNAEVVRAMARLRTLATRAEAASAIAEAEVTLQQLKSRAGSTPPPEVAQTEATLRSASAAFDAENFGGAVYLATQAKRTATLGRGRLAETGGTAARANERAFAVPVPLTVSSPAYLRASPSVSAALVQTAPVGTALTAYSYEGEWLKVSTPDGRSAWVHQGAVRGAPARP